MTRTSLLFIAALLLSGCAHYTTPGGSVSLGEFADEDIQEFYAATPASQFPAGMAVIRVQDKGYSARTSNYSEGRFEVVTARDIETDEALQKPSIQSFCRRVRPDVERRARGARLDLPHALGRLIAHSHGHLGPKAGAWRTWLLGGTS